MICKHLLTALLVAACAWSSAAWAQAAASRGELLYSTHCIACHTEKLHWRDQRQASDWASLKAQVRQWQANAMLGWTEDDVLAVTRHLNDTIYHYMLPAEQLGLLLPGAQR